MDGAATTRAQIRQQILAGENDIDTLSGFANMGKLQIPENRMPGPMPGPMGQYPQQMYNQAPPMNASLSNHDLLTPVNQRANPYQDPASRKGSMASMGKFFRRKGNTAFDDDIGMDIGDVAGDSITFNDIKHMRDTNGRYSISANTIADSAPIIPVLNARGPETQNNIQYRKYMNQQKKLNLASGARAMSLANSEQMPANSMTSYPDNRAMSLGQGPRAMSFQSNAVRGRPHPGMNGFPNGMPMQNGYPGPNGYMNPNMAPNGYPQSPMGPNGPHSMSMRSGMGPVSPGVRGPPPNMRTNSLNSNGAMGPMPMRQGPMQGPMPNGYNPMMHNGPYGPAGPAGPRSQSLTNQVGYGPGYGPGFQRQPGPQNMHAQPNGYPYNNPGMRRPMANQQPNGTASNDSIMNVVEEEEEKEEPEKQQDEKKNEPEKDRSEEDIVYDFENSASSPQVSRKSTLKKNNSLRVRRLDLFKNRDSKVLSDDIDEGRMSPTIDMDTVRDRESKKLMLDLDEEEVARQHEENANKLRTLGTSINDNDQNVYVTASEFTSPVKQAETAESAEARSDNVSPTRGSQDAQPSGPTRSTSTKNLVANTAFDNFKPPSSVIEENDSSEWVSEDGAESSQHLESKSTINPLNQHNDIYDNFQSGGQAKEAQNSIPPLSRNISLSRADSAAELHRLRPTSNLIADSRTQDLNESDNESVYSKADGRRSRNASISSRSKNFIKRLSRSGTKDSDSRVVSQSSSKKPLKFTKEELAIMTSNNDLQNELQLVASELAQSIKRELTLESRLRAVGGHEDIDTASFIDQDSQEESLHKARIIADLQEKLNNERRLRFISEEHAILSEHGQTPSALKLDYEKNELYKALVSKTDLVNQLQDKLAEYQDRRPSAGDDNLLEKYNELLKENSELKALAFNRDQSERAAEPSYGFDKKSLHLHRRSITPEREADKAEIMSLRNQREELREMITKLTSSQNADLKNAYDKIKTLEDKLERASAFNDKLSKRDKHSLTSPSTKTTFNNPGQGGKLQGLSVVSPRPTLFDEDREL